MNNHDISEQAYKNGYSDGFKAAGKIAAELPKIFDCSAETYTHLESVIYDKIKEIIKSEEQKH